MGTLFVISGPSGVGKGTLVKMLMEEDEALSLSISCTTRAPRDGEEEGVAYFFITKEEFLKRIDEGDFLEWDEHFGNYYGTPKSFVMQQLKTQSVILEIEVKGALQVKEALKGECDPVLIMVAPPDEEALFKRLAHRASESKEQLALRIERAKYELSFSSVYDYTVINDDLGEAKKTLQQIIETEKSKRRLQS